MTPAPAPNDPFAVPSAVADDLRKVDWSTTPLGEPDQWPSSLRTVVRAVLSSRFSMWMAWGPQLTFFCNDAYRRDTLGQKYPWALGRPASEVWAEVWPDVKDRVERVLSTGESTWDEALLLFLERSGFVEETYHTFSYSPLTDGDGEIVGMLCVVSEDTERVVAERRMALLRDLGSQARATSGEAAYLAETARVLGGSPTTLPFTLIYRYDVPPPSEPGAPRRATLVGRSGIPARHPLAPEEIDLTDPAVPWQGSGAAVGEGAVVDLDARAADLTTGSWPLPPTRAVLAPLLVQGEDEPAGFLVVGASPYRPLDPEYRDFVRLVAGHVGSGLGGARAYEAERRRADALAELDRAKTAFFTNISHEFRTPLTLLLGPAEDALLDAEHPLEPVHRDRLEIVQRNGARLLRLVNSLLDFSRLESGGLAGRYEPVDLAAETTQLAESFRSAVERVGLTLTVDAPPTARPVHVDREMWSKVVLNLLSNALKFTFEGGITVRVRDAGDDVEVAVIDTGSGIPPADQADLFQRFHRISGTRSRTHEGSGIGLALVAELVSLHGGEVSVRSAPGRGSEFVVRVPLGVEHLPPDQVASGGGDAPVAAGEVVEGYLAEARRWSDGDGPPDRHSADASVPPASHNGVARVLVVDDNADMRHYVAELLGEHYRVTTARDGAEALELALVDPPDLVVTDVMMPRLDGFGLLERLRAGPATRLVPVVMLSARAGADASVEGLEAGADDYLVKPFSARELLARVGANLELERTRQTRERLERNQQLFDRAERMARVGSWELDLTTGALAGSDEFARQLQLGSEELAELGFLRAMERRVHPDDGPTMRRALAAAVDGSASLDFQVRLVTPKGGTRTYRVVGQVERDADGAPVRLNGSNQDVTELLAAQESLAAAAATREAAGREHRIADELQRSLLPPASYRSDHLHVATYYRAGVEGTQVGGDWYDVIELGAGRTGLVIGDVMGRGVRAAAVMGQLRTAVRAYARLDMPPADILEFLDGVVRDLADDQIVTCVYAVYDPGEASLTWASAGHLPPLLLAPDGSAAPLEGSSGPPLGSGLPALSDNHLTLPAGSGLVLYTDGLVESRDTDIDSGIARLCGALAEVDEPFDDIPAAVVRGMLPDEPSDDVALVVARVQTEHTSTRVAALDVEAAEVAVGGARRFVVSALADWGVGASAAEAVELLTSELVTNAIVHGRPPVHLRVRRGTGHVVLEVRDSATYLPRRLRPGTDDEHGRGLQLVALLAERWGTRATPGGKAVWCMVRTEAP